MSDVVFQTLYTTVTASIGLAGTFALLSAWFPFMQMVLRQEKQKVNIWWQNPGLTNFPHYGFIIALLLLKTWEWYGKMKLSSMLPLLGTLSVIYYVIFSVALSVV